MKKGFVAIICFFVVIAVVFLGIKFSATYMDSYYSRRLIDAIAKEDKTEIEQILKERPSCVNAPQFCIPLGIYTLITEYRMNYPFMEACAVGNIEIINILIEAGADVNCNNGLTPLSIIYSGKGDNWYAISQLLIQKGAVLEYTTEYSGGKSCILQDIVASRGGLSLPGYVSEKDEEVWLAFDYALENCDHNNVNWMRILQHSVSNDRIKIVRKLLDEEYCDVNDASVGMTALMFAARDSTEEMVRLLLSYGADASFVDEDGKTAYDYAIEQERTEIAELLQKTGDGSVVPSELTP